MRMTNMALEAVIAVTHLQWIRPALVTLVILASVIVVVGYSCPPPHH